MQKYSLVAYNLHLSTFIDLTLGLRWISKQKQHLHTLTNIATTSPALITKIKQQVKLLLKHESFAYKAQNHNSTPSVHK